MATAPFIFLATGGDVAERRDADVESGKAFEHEQDC